MRSREIALIRGRATRAGSAADPGRAGRRRSHSTVIALAAGKFRRRK